MPVKIEDPPVLSEIEKTLQMSEHSISADFEIAIKQAPGGLGPGPRTARMFVISRSTESTAPSLQRSNGAPHPQKASLQVGIYWTPVKSNFSL